MRAARQIVVAASQRDATATPGWQASVQHLASTLTPEVSAAVLALVAEHVLPGAVPGPSPSHAIADLDLGRAAPLGSTTTAQSHNQPEPTAAF